MASSGALAGAIRPAGQPIALSELAPRVFPGHPDARRALEALLTVSTLARNKADEPGLVPTRVHGLFRGLHGLYACVNGHCDGRRGDLMSKEGIFIKDCTLLEAGPDDRQFTPGGLPRLPGPNAR